LTPSEVSFDDRWIVHHGLRASIRYDPAGIHADQALRHLEQHMDDMLDPDDGDAPATQLDDGLDQFTGLAIGQPATNLVEQ
jgi:hypothetical protein